MMAKLSTCGLCTSSTAIGDVATIDQESEIISTKIDIEDAEIITETQEETNTRVDREKGLTIEIESSEAVIEEILEEEKGHQRPTRKNRGGGNRDLDHQVYRQVEPQAHYIQVLAQATE